jgi:hypothetical protein
VPDEGFARPPLPRLRHRSHDRKRGTGDIDGALRYNAAGLGALLVLSWTYTAWWRARATGSPGRPWQNRPHAPIVVLALTVGWFIVRALPMEPFLSLRV